MFRRLLLLSFAAAAVAILPVGASLAQDAAQTSKAQRQSNSNNARVIVPGPWIAEMGEMGTTYGFTSLQQCLDTVSGIGGTCYRQ